MILTKSLNQKIKKGVIIMKNSTLRILILIPMCFSLLIPALATEVTDKVSEPRGGSQQEIIDGNYLQPTNKINQETSNSNITLGVEKGQNMISVIRNVFGYDLSSYHYVSFAELWGNDPLPSETRAIQRILTDLCMEIEAGERAPLGFLYQGNDVYTVVEQPDGSLELAQYKVQLVPATQSINGAELEAFPDYQIVDTETRTTTQDIVQSLYE